MLKRTLIIIFAGLILIGTAFSQANLPAYSGYINDYAKVLSASQKQALEDVSQSLKKETGAELAVAIVDSVEPLDPKLYAVKLFEKWGIGEKGKDNGVLILLAMKEKRIEIEVGYGLEGVLPDAKAGEILDRYAIPNFKQGKMGEGVLRTAQAVARIAGGEDFKSVVGSSGKSSDDSYDWVLFLILFGVFALIIFLSIKYGGKGSGGRGGWGSGGWSSGGSSFGGGRSGGGGAGRSW